MATKMGRNLSLHNRPRLSEVLVLLAPMLLGLVATFLPPLAEPSQFWMGLIAQSAFVLAPLAVALSGRLSWASIGLSRTGLGLSLVLGVLYSLPFVGLVLAAIWSGSPPGFQMTATEADYYLGVPLAVAFYLTFWGTFESVWMCYLIYAANRWLTGEGTLGWRALLLATLLFGLLHVQGQIVRGAPLPQALGSVVIGLALLIPGTIPKFTGNAWGLVLWFTVTNF